MLNHFPLRFFLFRCLIFLSCFISPAIYAEFNSIVLEKLKTENVVDTTHTLTNDEIQDLRKQNEQLYQESHIDFKILMISSTHGESIEQYALDVFDTLKIGNEKLDNGLLLVVAKDDRKMRFEVGYGLEGEFTDIEAGRIIRYDLAPYFKQNQYYDGIQIAMDSVSSTTSSLKQDNSLTNTKHEELSDAADELSFGGMILILMIYGIGSLILGIPALLLFLYFRKTNKTKSPPPEIVIGTDGKEYIKIKKNRERPFEPYSQTVQHKEQKVSSVSTSSSHSSSSKSSNTSSSTRDTGGSSGGGGASGSW